MPRRKRGQIIDAMDARIIAQLAQDSCMPNVTVAKTVGLSETAMRRRLERLLNTNVVRVVGQVNPEAIDYRGNAILTLLVDFGQGSPP